MTTASKLAIALPDVGAAIGGYRVERVDQLPQIAGAMIQLRHERTRAHHLHIARDDRENTFSVAFKTIPTDATGVAHILEHTALCGSAQYPVRDPFFSMLKRSLSTFMNAFTASDWTMYPFSTPNRTDYVNLMSVYLDAAFFPRLDRLSFKQEGHRVEWTDADQLAFKGVVFNEMKGAMSAPDQVMGRSLLNALYPDTTYRFNSGGDPAHIPDLTHEQLVAFHQRHYHPSNAYFYTYGDIPLEDTLARIETTVLDQFQPIDPGTVVPPQPRWDAPRTAEYQYLLDRETPPEKKYQICLAWLCADIQDSLEVTALVLLEQILMGNTASPLRKALIDSGYGSALSDSSGLDADNRDTAFSAGLKDVAREDGDRIEAVILQTIQELADNGIDLELIDAAIHQLEFHRKEIKNSPYPYGLRLLMTVASAWFHGSDPLPLVDVDPVLDQIRAKISDGFFESRLRRYFLDNPHRVRLTLVPDASLDQQQADAEQATLTAIRQALTEVESDQIRNDGEALRLLQDTEEDLSVLPTLGLDQIPPSVPSVMPDRTDTNRALTLFDQPTAGIYYTALAAGVTGIAPEDLPLVPLCCHLLPKVGTRRHSFEQMARRIDLTTGGLGLAPAARTRFDDDGACLPYVAMTAKCLGRNIAPMYDILGELLTEADFSDLARLGRQVREFRAGLEAMVLQNGHRLALMAAARTFGPAAALSELWGGIHQIKAIKALSDGMDGDAPGDLAVRLSGIAAALFRQGNLRSVLIGDTAMLTEAEAFSVEMTAGLPQGGDAFGQPQVAIAERLPHEGWQTATAVSFVASVLPSVRLTDPAAPALAVLAKILRSGYLHKEIREKGGAYGGFAMFSPEDGTFGFGSYRDPRLVETLSVYAGAADYLKSGVVNDEDIKEAILQICSEIDKPEPPGAAARKAYFRGLVGLTDEIRAQYKSRLLSLNRDSVLNEGLRLLGEMADRQAVVVISGPDQLAEANQQLADHPLSLFRI